MHFVVEKELITHLHPLTLADNSAFRNALVSMRPKSTSTDLPSSYNVKVQLHNKFMKHIGELKDVISVSESLSL